METSNKLTGQQSSDLTLFAVDTLASLSASLGDDKEQTTQDTCGLGCEPPLANYDPTMRCMENVRGHLTMGGIEVIGELAEIGYDAEWRIVSAAGVGAPHRRDRLIIVAYPAQLFSDGVNDHARGCLEPEAVSELRNGGRASHVANTASKGLEGAVGQVSKGNGNGFTYGGAEMANTDSEQLGQRRQSQHAGQARKIWEYNGTGQARYDGWQWWEVEPDVGRVADGIPHQGGQT
jgi:DNA (cytosine-5)-methyltransferase 1